MDGSASARQGSQFCRLVPGFRVIRPDSHPLATVSALPAARQFHSQSHVNTVQPFACDLENGQFLRQKIRVVKEGFDQLVILIKNEEHL